MNRYKRAVLIHNRISARLPLKNVTICFLLSCLLAWQPLSAQEQLQDAKITLDLTDASFEQVVKSIEKQTNKMFFFNFKSIDENKKYTLKLNNATIQETLDEFLKGSDLQYKLFNNQIIIYSKSVAGDESAVPRNINGTINDEDGLPMVGVNITIKGQYRGTMSSVDGAFNIAASSADTLVISFLGYLNEEIAIHDQTVVNVAMTPDLFSLEEIVVIGYGEIKKEELTSSVTKISEEDFNQGVTSSPINLIQGKVPGLSIINNAGNDPNAPPQVTLRGIGTIRAGIEPLVLIDGITSSMEDLSALNPSEIESFNVLKDASSAAIYGSRGSNGVIIVKTKGGSKEDLSLEYSSYYFTETPTSTPKVLDADQYLNLLEENGLSAVNNDYGFSTEWFDELIRTPFNHYHGLSLSGGSEKSYYRASISYKKADGMVINTNNKSITGRLSFGQKMLNDIIDIDGTFNGSRVDMTFTDYGAFEQALIYNPTAPVYNADGTYFEFPGVGPSNPVASLNQKENGGVRNTLSGSLNLRLNITRNLNLSVKGAAKSRNFDGYSYESVNSRYSVLSGRRGEAKRSADFESIALFESLLNYSLVRKWHSVNFLAGYSFEQEVGTDFEAENRDFLLDAFKYNNLSAGSYLEEGRADMESDKSKSNLVAFFGRINYAFQEKYLLSASLPREGSSRFGENNKWGLFPAVSAGWRLSNEDFFNISSIDELKLRGGYGITGNQDIGLYRSITRYGASGYGYYGNDWVTSYGPVSNSDPNLQWETNKEINFGVDFALLNNRVDGSIDYYNRLTENLIDDYDAQVPSNIYQRIYTNVGSLRNKGIETILSVVPVKRNKINLKTTVSFSWNHNELVSLSNKDYKANSIQYNELPAPGNLGDTYILEEGQPVGSYYGLKFIGFTDEGEWIMEDVNNDGQYSTDDKQFIGQGQPKYMYSMTNTLTAGNFDFSIYLRGAAGFDILNTRRIYYENEISLPYNLYESTLNVPLDDVMMYSDFYIEKGDYLKIDNITLGYNFKISNFQFPFEGRVYLTATNIATFTNYSGADPEVGTGDSDGLTPGYDRRDYYPRSRTFLIGLNIKI